MKLSRVVAKMIYRSYYWGYRGVEKGLTRLMVIGAFGLVLSDERQFSRPIGRALSKSKEGRS
jgi:hypothetical protein